MNDMSSHPTPVLDRIKLALARPAVGPSSDYDLNPDVLARLPGGRKLRPAAVLIGLIERDTGLSVILTRRSADLKHHPGQIAFPGGKVEDHDVDAAGAALREAQEEVGLAPNLVTPLGALEPHETVTGFSVTPIVASVSPAFHPVPDDSEVAEVFEVPLTFLTDPVHLQIHYRPWRGTRRAYYAIPYGPYYVWGATARMLKAFSDQVAGTPVA